MRRSRSHYQDEMSAPEIPCHNCFGLIGAASAERSELHGFEVSLDGTVVVPELCPQPGGTARESDQGRQ
jgi:hypothetical protein